MYQEFSKFIHFLNPSKTSIPEGKYTHYIKTHNHPLVAYEVILN
jgi:hypothetical protein